MNQKILVADDSSTIQKVIKIAFGSLGAQINEAASYVETVNKLSQTPHDLLIIDASLPGTHGAEEFQKIISTSPQTPIIVLVGTYEKIDHDQFEKIGLSNFLKKPFESKDIVNLAQSLLQTPLAEEKAPMKTPQAVEFKLSDDENRSRPSDETRPRGIDNNESPHPDEGEITPMPSINLDFVDPPEDSQTAAMIAPERKGRRAFDNATDSFAAPPPPPPPPPVAKPNQEFRLKEPSQMEKVSSKALDHSLRNELELLLPDLAKEAIASYCRENFHSIAREIITEELRRLADEKARHLVDQ